jgi:SAM-dependent methyltransferase
MRDGARRLARGVAEELNLRGRRRLLDLGGGPGEYAAAFARRNPALRVTVVDLPDVAAVGREMIEDHADVADRVGFHAADIEAEPLPEGADSAFLSHVIHGNDEETNRALYRRVAAALVPRGLLIVRDFFLDADGTTPASASLFSLNMLVSTIGGRSYSAKETARELRRAGFRTVAHRRSRAVPDTGYLLARR